MNGVVDYKIEGDTENKLVSLRLRQRGSELDYYIGYNRASGFNMGTQENANEIVVWEKPSGGPKGFGESWKVASLKYEDQRYIIKEFGPKNQFVEIKLLVDTIEVGNPNQSKQDAPISVTSYKAADDCPYQPVDQARFKLGGKTDAYPLETSWSLKMDSLFSGYVDFGSGYKSNSAFQSTKMLCPGACYVFEMNDIYGDGLGEGGFFKGELDGVEIFSGSANFGGQDMRRFCVPITTLTRPVSTA